MSKFYVNEIVFKDKQVTIPNELKESIMTRLTQTYNIQILNFDVNLGSPTNSIMLETNKPMFKNHVRLVLKALGHNEANTVAVYISDDVFDYHRRFKI